MKDEKVYVVVHTFYDPEYEETTVQDTHVATSLEAAKKYLKETFEKYAYDEDTVFESDISDDDLSGVIVYNNDDSETWEIFESEVIK